MEVHLKDIIVAAVTLHPDRVGGGVPVFVAQDEEEQRKVANNVAKITTGVVHDLENGTYIVVKH